MYQPKVKAGWNRLAQKLEMAVINVIPSSSPPKPTRKVLLDHLFKATEAKVNIKSDFGRRDENG